MSNSKLPTDVRTALPSRGQPGRPYDIRERTFEFALRILRVSGSVPATLEGNEVRRQLARAAMSIGANVEEADGAVSKADKRKSLVIARKEAREVRYWLRLIERQCPDRPYVSRDIREAQEILSILSAIVAKLA